MGAIAGHDSGHARILLWLGVNQDTILGHEERDVSSPSQQHHRTAGNIAYRTALGIFGFAAALVLEAAASKEAQTFENVAERRLKSRACSGT
mmetsp:Transcript_10792/g.33047  ORF Transcript_10792/g.33047 Transcript_10792/m.33047 type:complete len:92 (-) Transcript_10792:22-297(-)